MGGWELLSKLDDSEVLRVRAEAEEKLNREKTERESRARDDERLRQRVEAEVRARLTEERAKGAPSTGIDGSTLGCLGGVLFVGGVVVVLNSFSSRDKEQRQHNGLFGYIPGTREYEKIDTSGYEAVAFVAGAVALLGLGLVIAGLSRRK
jgi:TctA family transporter